VQQYGHIIGIYRRRRRSIGRGGKEGGGEEGGKRRGRKRRGERMC